MPITPKEIQALATTPPPDAFDPTKAAPPTSGPFMKSLRYRFSEGRARLAHLETKFGLPSSPERMGLIEVNSKLDVLDEIDFQVSAEAGSPVTPQASSPLPSKTISQSGNVATVATPTTPIMNQYAALKDPKARVEFYNKNSASFDAEFAATRAAAAQSEIAARPADPFAAQDAANLATYAAIRHPGDKVAFYRENSRSLDRAIERNQI